MTDKELRKLKRADLIEILYYLSRENDELREENKQLREKLDMFITETVSALKKTGADIHEERSGDNAPEEDDTNGQE